MGWGDTFAEERVRPPGWPELESGVPMTSLPLFSLPTGCLSNTGPATLQNPGK